MAKPRMCSNCRAFVDPDTKICPYCDHVLGQSYAKRVKRADGGLWGIVPETHVTTFIILFVNFALFVGMLLLSQKLGSVSMFGIDLRVAEVFGAKIRYNVLVEDQWWRLVTAGFLHLSVFHFGMNAWVLFSLGPAAEVGFGTSRYLVIYFLSTVTGYIASLYLTGANSVAAGASASLCGLIGALMAQARRTGHSMAWSFYMRWMIIIVVLGFVFPAIDQAAHLGGFAGGFVVGWVAASPRVNRSIESLWKGAATAATIGVAVCLAIAYSRVMAALSS